MPRPPRAWQGSRPMRGALDEASGDPGPCLELGLCRLGPPERALGRFRGSRRLVGADSPSSRPGIRFLPAIASARVLSSASHRLTSRGQPGRHLLGTSGAHSGARAGHWRSAVLHSHRTRALSPCWLPAGVTFRSQKPRLGALHVDPAAPKPAAVQWRRGEGTGAWTDGKCTGPHRCAQDLPRLVLQIS